jgi:hypothetical protein
MNSKKQPFRNDVHESSQEINNNNQGGCGCGRGGRGQGGRGGRRHSVSQQQQPATTHGRVTRSQAAQMRSQPHSLT